MYAFTRRRLESASYHGVVPDLRRRAIRSELLDDAPAAEAAQSLRDLVRINCRFGGHAILIRMLSPLVGRMESFTFVDVGSATGDAAALVRANYPAARTVAVDRDFFHVSQGQGLRICGDAFRLPLRDGAADLVYCSLFLHHFTDDQVVTLLREFRRVAARFILVSDLERHILAWGFIPATRWLFRWHPLTVHDAPVSVAASFRATEMLALAKCAGLERAEVRTHRPAFRISLVAPVT